MSLDKKSQLPLYAQLMKEIKDQIRKGTYKEEIRFPQKENYPLPIRSAGLQCAEQLKSYALRDFL